MLFAEGTCDVYVLVMLHFIPYMQAPQFDNLTQTEFDVYTVLYMIENNSIEFFGFIPYPALNFTIESLLNATQFSVYVALNNSAGLGDYSSPVATGRTNVVGELYSDRCCGSTKK